MPDGLLPTLQRRFAAAAAALPRALPAIESDDPTAFLARYRRDALAGLQEGAFRKLRTATREEKEIERRRNAAKRALDKAGRLDASLAGRISGSRDTIWLEDLLRPVRKSSDAAPHDPMIEVARTIVAAGPVAVEATIHDIDDTPETDEAAGADDDAPQGDGSASDEATADASADSAGEAPAADAPTDAPKDGPADAPAEAAATPAESIVTPTAVTPTAVTQTTEAPATEAATPDAAVADASSGPAVAPTVAPTGAQSIEELLKPFCGADGAHPTAADQRQRLVGLVASLLGDDPDLRAVVRAVVKRRGTIATDVSRDHASSEPWKAFVGSRRPLGEIRARDLLLLRRGQKLGAVRVKTEIPEEERAKLLAGPLAPAAGHPYAEILAEAAKDSLDRVLIPAAGSTILAERRRNGTRSLLPRIMQTLQERLMTPPAGGVPVVAVAPGTPGSCRILLIDATGRPGTSVAVHPFPPQNEKEAAAKALADVLRDSGAKLVAVAASRKARATRAFAEDALALCRDLGASPVLVNEAAAARWAETDDAKADAPELTASARTALSLGRSVQDPLREAARWDLTELPLDPAQRDLDQGELRLALDEVLEACVADVGVDVNTAPVSLLARVPGLGMNGAKAIVTARAVGTFGSRAKIKEVPGLSGDQWQRAGGFLRVKDGVDPIDATGVHPTGVDIVVAIAAAKSVEPSALVGAEALLADLDPAQFAGAVHTVSDVESVIAELRAGSADPRTKFVAPAFNPGVQNMKDLQPGMEMDGVVASVSTFGAFVDVGVRQQGLVHVSEMSHEFIREPSQVVKPGQKVRVKVLSIDPAKRRISLSMKALIPAPERPAETERPARRNFGAPAGAAPSGGGFGGSGGGGGGFGGAPRAPRRDGGGGFGGGPGGPGGGFPRGGRDDRRGGPPGPFQPERPGTAPRRAAKGRRPGEDNKRDDALGLSRNREDRKGKKGAALLVADEAAEQAPRSKPIVKGPDPFQAQLDALAAKLGLAAGRRAPAPAPVAVVPASEEPKNRKERRAMLLAQRAASGATTPAETAPASDNSAGSAETPAAESPAADATSSDS
ncbi:MAG: S1 RNA-binding domain-containing protein [Planctomycetes bacterium]|nr:S1 RNA-binding domain-containing protein [Planctomycetota bacterium]